MKKFIIITIIIIIAGLIGFSLITKHTTKTDFELKTKSTKTNQQSKNLRQATLRIDGMTCTSCAVGATYALKEKEGVINASVDYDSKSGQVTYDPLKISKNEIIQAIKPYIATIIKDVPVK